MSMLSNSLQAAPSVDNLGDLLRLRALQTPDKRAYSFLEKDGTVGGDLTYKELDSRAGVIADRLRESCKPGERALLIYPAGLDFVAAFFGCMYAGVIAVPVPAPESRRNAPVCLNIAQDAQPAVTLTTTQLLHNTLRNMKDGLPAAMDFVATDSISSSARSGDTFSCELLHENGSWTRSIAYLQYTSGSTSSPRGVVVSHSNVLSNLRAIDADFRHDEESVSLTWLPHFHDMGLVYGVLQPVFNCFRCLILSPATFSREPLMWPEIISRYRVTHSGGPNFAYDLCARKIERESQREFDLSCWRVAFNGAEPIHAETLARFASAFAKFRFRRESLYMAYGLAEATLKVSGRFHDSPEILDQVDASDLGKGRVVRTSDRTGRTTTVVSCGVPAPDTEVYIVDTASGAICPEDQIGEVWVKGPGVTLGYWNNPGCSNDTFKAHMPDSETPCLRTGDLGYFSRGEIFLTGRIKDLIIMHGRNLYPHDIEATVMRAAGRAAKGVAAAFSVCLDSEEKVAVILEIAHRPQSFESLADQILSDVALHHGVPVDLLVLVKFGQIPRTTSGKVRRNAARTQFLEDALDIVWKRSVLHRRPGEPEIGPRTPTEAQLHVIWCEVLGRERIGMEDRFLDLGGDSLMAAQICARASAALNRDLPVQIIFEANSISALASQIDRMQKDRQGLQEENSSLLARIEDLSAEELDMHLSRLGAQLPTAEN